jgi:hypothetical protein
VRDVIAVDWSGRASPAAARRHIWLAHARDGELLELSNGRTRAEVVDTLLERRAHCPEGLAVGLDFSFSLPAWFVRQRGQPDAAGLWRDVAAHGEQWVDECRPPFWGKKGDRVPTGPEQLRRTERDILVGGRRPMSTFHLRGAGTVGTGSLRGMPHLLELQAGGFSIWPFDEPGPHVVLEVYPRLCTGPVVKRDPTARARALAGGRWPLTEPQRALATASEDAFDAAVSALVMSSHAETFRTLHRADDPITLLEGQIWDPRSID